MPKPKAPSCYFAPGTIEHSKTPMSKMEKTAVLLFLFLMLMLLSYCIASIYGYVELRGGLA